MKSFRKLTCPHCDEKRRIHVADISTDFGGSTYRWGCTSCGTRVQKHVRESAVRVVRLDQGLVKEDTAALASAIGDGTWRELWDAIDTPADLGFKEVRA